MASANDPDLYEELWVENVDVAESTLQTPFLQRMQLGDLPADSYVKFFMQDLIYMVKVTDMLKNMSETVKDEELREFMKARYESFKNYAEDRLKEFSINPQIVSDIIPTPATKKYISDYEDIINNLEPIFFGLALLPGVRLWKFLGDQLNETSCNPYFAWKTSNMRFRPDKFRELLNKRLTKEEDKKKAHDIYRQQIQNEHQIFASSLKSEQ